MRVLSRMNELIFIQSVQYLSGSSFGALGNEYIPMEVFFAGVGKASNYDTISMISLFGRTARRELLWGYLDIII